MKKYAILGMGESGKGAASYLHSLGENPLLLDKKPVVEGWKVFPEDTPLEGIDTLIVSPGIPSSHPTIVAAKQRGIPTIGEVEFAFSHLSQYTIGITGSNGKTSAVLSTVHVLERLGKKAKALGNVGVALSRYLLEKDEEEILVVELSSFQLLSLVSRPLDLAVVLNITPNHLDWHSSMEEYVQTKLSIRDRCKEGGAFWISSQVQREYGVEATLFEEPLSVAIATFLGGDKIAAQEAYSSFQKPPHRLEWVADIQGVSYYNDSKSSNVHSVLYALSRFDRPLVLIVGGKDKGASYRPWIEAMQGKVKRLLVYGAAASKIVEDLGDALLWERFDRFGDAVQRAKEIGSAPDVVLLSPGCSSYDQFTNYEERGRRFCELVLSQG